MSTPRVEQLLRFHEEDPSDPFPIYGLALEFIKSDTTKSHGYFEHLLKNFSDYLPTYYHAAKLKTELGHIKDAIETYEKGIALAKKLGDTQTLRELQSAYDELTF
jgi:tetratricopeptide (TPR) repeat protein